MGKLALQIEHTYQDRVIGMHLLEGERAHTVGSVRGANLRLVGDDVASLHAAFELREDQWTLSDLGSPGGTWVAQKQIVELGLDGPTVIHIGAHRLKVTPHRMDRKLFAADELADLAKGTTFHQAVVLHRGLLKKTFALAANKSFSSGLEGFAAELPAPPSGAWVVTTRGEWTIKQRLAAGDVLEAELETEGLRRPGAVLSALGLLVTVLGAFVLFPRADEHAATPDNQYTRMIFDGQKVRQKKLSSEKIRRSMPGQNAGATGKPIAGDAGPKTGGAPKSAAGAHVVMNLKNAGLGALIGKVAARAGKTAQLVEAAGAAADSGQATGRALWRGGGGALDALKAGRGGSMKVGGLATVGTGGGGTGFKGSGVLGAGNLGQAEVGVLEEETEVDGGLDKEAIARVIRSQLGQIRYCYERQLSASPDLYGKVLIKFTIGSAGSVVAQNIGTTSLNNAMVEGCILRRVAGWQFPTPKGGTNVLVTYPFLFKSTK